MTERADQSGSPDEWETIDADENLGRARFMVSLDRAQLDRLRQRARQSNLPVAELVREAIEAYYERPSSAPDARPPL